MYKDSRLSKSQQELDEWYINGEFYNIDDNLKIIDFEKFVNMNEKVNRILFFSKDIIGLEKIYSDALKENNIKMKYEKNYKDHQLLLVSRNYSKANGVKEMCKLLGIFLKETMAFGDAENDIEMLNVVGKGISMKNAKCNLGVDEITQYTNNEDGVARYMERVLNKGEI